MRPPCKSRSCSKMWKSVAPILLSLVFLVDLTSGQDMRHGTSSVPNVDPATDDGSAFTDDEVDQGTPRRLTETRPAAIRVEGCRASQYGCCNDGVTIAMGPKDEGCPDGPRLVGGCAGTRHGCCGDGRTGARGPNKEGCPESRRLIGGCAGTRYGCCADLVTSARGDKKEGCPETRRQPMLVGGCAGTRHGCCADGIRSATGPRSEGCPEFEELIVGGCAGTRYGCCPDGTTGATGENHFGCPEFDIAACGYDKDPGGCTDYTKRFYYSSEFGQCLAFWFGNCKGNANNFKTKEECESKCISVGFPQACRLPSVTGRCRAAMPRFFYNSTSSMCERFTYGGCDGNNNNFNTSAQCQSACNGVVAEQPVEVRVTSRACDTRPCQNGFECQDFPNGTYSCSCNPDWGQNCMSPPRYWCFSDRECGRGMKCVRERECKGEDCHVYARCTVSSQRYQCDQNRCPRNQDCVNDPSVREGYFCVDPVSYQRPKAVVLGCEDSKFGCCRYDRTPASGPNMQGCPCRSTPYGCCPDDVTPAVDARRSNCDDQIEGSGSGVPCERTRHGCCDDGVTIRGIAGCPDSPDSETRRRGNNRVGVPCERTRHGCCDDGVTIRGIAGCPGETRGRGNNRVGVPCERTRHGCCDDGVTIRGIAGCPDKTLGNGNNIDNEVLPEVTTWVRPGAVNCTAAVKRGLCIDAWAPRYRYDSDKMSCEHFWSGGCGNDDNVFLSREECEIQCASPAVVTSPDGADTDFVNICDMPRDQGPCRARVLRYHYNPQERRCLRFTYGGCQGNENNFESLEGCQRECMGVVPQPKVTTTQAPRTPAPRRSATVELDLKGPNTIYEGEDLKITCTASGPTRINVEWFIDGEPVPGNSTRVTLSQQSVATVSGFRQTGHLMVPRVTQDDAKAYYCRGYRETSRLVVSVRPRAVAPTRSPTTTTTTTTTEAPNREATPIVMEGNTEVTEGSPLRITCMATGARRPRGVEWFHNGTLIENPSENGFDISDRTDPRDRHTLISDLSVQEARFRVSGQYHCRSKPYGDYKHLMITVLPRREEATTDVTESDDPKVICSQPKVIGRCRAAFPRFFFDSASGTCKNFIYGGCDGNLNNFESLDACERRCSAYLRRVNEVIPSGTGEEEVTEVERQRVADACELIPEKGSCTGYNIKWYYSAARYRCERFIYTGCDGNDNRFDTKEECQAQCSSTRGGRPTRIRQTTPAPVTTTTTTTEAPMVSGRAACSLKSDRGDLCKKWKLFYYFDPEIKRCRMFYYGGCGGNGNRFETDEECKAACASSTEPTRAPRPERCYQTQYGCCDDGVTTARDMQRSNCPETTRAPRPERCYQTQYGCCDDGVTTARDMQRSNCPEATRRPERCYQTQYGCCDDGVTTARDMQKSNCPDKNVVIQPGSRDRDTEVMVSRGSNALLRCTLRGRDIMWYRDNFLVQENRQFRVHSNGTLELLYMRDDMEGFYTCRVPSSPLSERFKVDMAEPLAMIPGPALVSTDSGKDAYLYCQATGRPAPRFSWSRDRRVVQSVGRHQVFGNGTLIVRDVRTEDEGDYMCTAENGVAVVRKEVILRIRETIEATIQRHKNRYMEGSTIHLTCIGSGFPEPSLEWHKDGKLIQDTSNSGGKVKLNGGSLTINSAAISDAGLYKCIAFNDRITDEALTTVQIKFNDFTKKCEDTMRETKCHLIVSGKLCGFRIFASRCCQSCRRSGQI